MPEQIMTFCAVCGAHCSAKATVENGKLLKWEQDKESGYSYKPCTSFKGLANKEINEHPDRLKYPVKRDGERGSGKWKRISWDEALDTIANKFNQLKSQYGPESIAMSVGEPKHFEFVWLQRLATAIGTPNIASPHHICGATRYASASITFGPRHPADPAIDHWETVSLNPDDLPRLLVIWGYAMVEKIGTERDWVNAIIRNGGKLIVIDPRRLAICDKAEMWIKPRPGSDAALAMGMLKILIDEKLYDADFVRDWTVGFDKLCDEVNKFTIEEVEKATWVPRAQIEQLARMYAQYKPAQLLGRGNTWSQGTRNFQGMRLIQILRAIVTPENIPGWKYELSQLPQNTPRHMYLLDMLRRPLEGNVGRDHKYTVKTSFIPYQSLTQGIVDGTIKAAMFTQCDPIISYPNARRVYDAFLKLDFSVTVNIFMVPTGTISDIVLPVATTNECNTIACFTGAQPFRAIPKIIDAPGESWSDVKIINEIGKRMGLGKYFFDTDEQVLDYALEPSGLTWQEFKTKVRIFLPEKTLRTDKSTFFTTPSGKVEIYSERAITEYGCEPIPTWKHVSAIPQAPKEYPLLLTNYCDEQYKLTGYKHVQYFRKRKPQPTVQIHPDVAGQTGIQDGDWAYIETKLGRIMQKVVIDKDIDPKVVMASFGWWFPEEPSNSMQWDKSNINILIEDDKSEIATGSVDLRGIPCRVYKA